MHSQSSRCPVKKQCVKTKTMCVCVCVCVCVLCVCVCVCVTSGTNAVMTVYEASKMLGSAANEDAISSE